MELVVPHPVDILLEVVEQEDNALEEQHLMEVVEPQEPEHRLLRMQQ
tara:strand:- start:24 stop:164 length:141 start_codon:yes stop_codon:yes gene_type:complete